MNVQEKIQFDFKKYPSQFTKSEHAVDTNNLEAVKKNW